MKKIVVRLRTNLQKRHRAGFRFTQEAVQIEVTNEQLKLIEDDEHLLIVKSGLAHKEAIDNAKALETKNAAEQVEKENAQKVDPVVPPATDLPETDAVVDTPPETPTVDTKTDDTPPADPVVESEYSFNNLMQMRKEQLVKILTDKDENDFEPEATKSALASLIINL